MSAASRGKGKGKADVLFEDDACRAITVVVMIEDQLSVVGFVGGRHGIGMRQGSNRYKYTFFASFLP